MLASGENPSVLAGMIVLGYLRYLLFKIRLLEQADGFARSTIGWLIAAN
jgi:hypothetical protein